MMKGLVFLLCLVFAQVSTAQDSVIWESQVRAFEEKDLVDPPPKGETVVVGSSSIRLWSTIRTDLSPSIVVPRGIGGAFSTDVLYYLDRLVLVHEPKRVLIYVGENDISGLRTPQQVIDTIKTIVGNIHSRLPTAKIILMSIKPSIARFDKWPAMQSANQLMASYAGTDPRVNYVDVSTSLLGAGGQPVREYYVDDLLHLSSRGYQEWTRVIRPVLLDSTPSAAYCSALGSAPWGSFGARQRSCGFSHSAN